MFSNILARPASLEKRYLLAQTKRERVCVCEKERERVCVCVRERERGECETIEIKKIIALLS